MAKVVVVTGGTGALGQSVVKQFIAHDFQVVVTYRVAAELEALQTSLGDQRRRLDAYMVDVTNELQLRQWAKELQQTYQQIVGLVSLVGGFASGTIGENLTESFDKMMTLNAKSFLLTANALLPLISRPGAMVAVAAKPALEPAKNLGLYAASKAAVVSLVKTMALELRDQDIVVNAVAPSTIDTPANRQAMPKANPTDWVAPDDIAQAIFYLVTQRPTSGAVLPVFGKS